MKQTIKKVIKSNRMLNWIYRRFRPAPTGKPAVGSISEVAGVYDHVYANNEQYDSLHPANEQKLKYMLQFAQNIGDGKILDAGCGRGNALRFLLDKGIKIEGIELSKTCFDKYLQDLPAINSDIVSHAKSGTTYDALICTDVLEHIPPDVIDDTLKALSELAPKAFFGIANHSSVHEGNELHVIQEGIEWWQQKLKQYFDTTRGIEPQESDSLLSDYYRQQRFFFIIGEKN